MARAIDDMLALERIGSPASCWENVLLPPPSCGDLLAVLSYTTLLGREVAAVIDMLRKFVALDSGIVLYLASGKPRVNCAAEFLRRELELPLLSRRDT